MVNENWKEPYSKGKEILHAVRIIGNKHLIKQISHFQDGLRTAPMGEYAGRWGEELEQFKMGIELSGNKINKGLKQNIIEYCESAKKYHDEIKAGQ